MADRPFTAADGHLQAEVFDWGTRVGFIVDGDRGKNGIIIPMEDAQRLRDWLDEAIAQTTPEYWQEMAKRQVKG